MLCFRVGYTSNHLTGNNNVPEKKVTTTCTTTSTITVKLKIDNKQEKNPTKDERHRDWQIITSCAKRITNHLYEERRDFLSVTQILPVNTAGPTLCVTYRPSIKI